MQMEQLQKTWLTMKAGEDKSKERMLRFPLHHPLSRTMSAADQFPEPPAFQTAAVVL